MKLKEEVKNIAKSRKEMTTPKPMEVDKVEIQLNHLDNLLNDLKILDLDNSFLITGYQWILGRKKTLH